MGMVMLAPAIPTPTPTPTATPAPAPVTPKRERKSYWAGPVESVLAKLGDSIVGDKPMVVEQKVLAALADEIRQSGRKPPTRGLICRKAGFWQN
jgi:hypothetical protein